MRTSSAQVGYGKMAEDINQDDDDIEEEEDRGADAQQTLDDLTVLTGGGDGLDDVDEQTDTGDDVSEWAEPSATMSLSTIHTGSRPTDSELLSNLIPEGEVIVEEGDIVRTQEEVGQELDEVEPEEFELDTPNRGPEEDQSGQEFAGGPAGPAAPDATAAPEVTEAPAEDEVTEESLVEDITPAAAVVADEPVVTAAPGPEATLAPTEEPEPTSTPEPLSTTDAAGSEDAAIALDIDAGAESEVTIADVPSGASLNAGTDNGDGTWTVAADDLDGLTITPAADSDVDFTLQVTAGNDTQTLDVTVEAVADAPTATADDAAGLEDTAIDLDLGSALSDVDGSESLSVTISGVPDGATLSAGTDNGDGTWTLSSDDLSGLQITPPADFHGEIPLTMTATSTEADGGDTATTEVPFTVTVADTLDTTAAATDEDTSVALSIELPDGVTSLTIADVPDGAVLSAGTDNGDGTWTLSADDLDGLTVAPPANSDADFTLQVTADGVTQELNVTVDAVADVPDVSAQDTSGTQDTAIPLDLSSALNDTDGSETLSITIHGVPDGAALSAGTDNGDGTWTVDPADLDGLSITPPAGSTDTMNLSLEATATDTDQDSGDTSTATNTIDFAIDIAADGTFSTTDAVGNEDTAIALIIDPGDASQVTVSDVPDGASLSAGTDNGDGTWTINAADLDGLTITPPGDSDADFTMSVSADGVTSDLDVTVNAVADAPTATATDAAGSEGDAIDLDLGGALTDVDGSETLSMTISGVPDGATLSVGTDNGDGTWSVDPADLANVSITPPDGFFGDIDLTLVSTSTETDGGDTATTEVPFTVSVASDGDFGVAASVGDEDTAIALTIDDGGADTITIADVPDGAVLSAGTDNGDGTWTLSSDDLNGLTITPSADSDVDFTLSVTADGETAALDVTVDAVADAPTASAQDVIGEEDSAVQLNLDAALTDTDGTESLSLVISDVPAGASLSAGTDNGDGTWSIDPADLEGLSITPPTGFDGSFDLTLTSTSTETDPDASVQSASTDTIFTVTVNPDDQEVVFDVTAAEGLEDTAIALDIDPGTATEITIADVPDGAVLSAGTDNGDGTWTLSAEDLDSLTVTPPTDSDADFTLSVTAEGETQTLDVNVLAVADRPDLDVQTSVGNEDTAIPLNISSGLIDTDGSETLSISIDIVGIPDGAVLSSNGEPISIDDGTATLTPEQLSGLTITPPQDFFGDINLQVTATATEEGAAEDVAVETAASTASFGVTVRPVEDNPVVSAQSASGDEDTVIALDLSANMEAGVTEEVSSIIIGNVPEGSTFSAGTDNGDGTWTLEAGDLDGLTVTPPQDWNGTQFMTMTAISSDGGVNVTGFTLDVADTPDLTVTDASGMEDGAIAMDISAGLGESVTISNVPDGAEFSAGTDNGDGTWTIAAEDLDGLTLTPPENADDDFTLTVTNGEQVLDMDVAVTAEADAPTVAAEDVSGTEDSAISLDLSSGLTDTDGSETLSVTISGVPDGAILSAGTDNGDGTWSIDPADLASLSVTPPADFSGSFDLTVEATSTEADGGDTAVTSETFTVNVAGDADDPTLSVDNTAAGTEDGAIALDINAGLSDSSETLSVTISGVPDGAALSAGTDNGDGTWTLDAGDLDGLTVTPPADSDGDFQLSVTATSTDGTDTATTSGTIDVSVAADADAPTLTLDETASGTEDGAINLDIASGLTDTDGSESLSVTVSGVPDGAALSAGTDNGDGTWTLDAGDLDGLQVTPPADFSGSFDLAVSATSTEADGGDTATTTGTITVDVAADADDPTLTIDTTAEGGEDTAIALDIDAGVSDGSEVLSVTISGVPDGAALSAGTDNGDGTWTLDAGDLDGLTVTPSADSDADFSLSVSATSTDGTDTATTTGTIDVSVAADADAPTLTLDETATGTEDGAINLDIASGLTDTDGSETLSVTVSGVPDGASLSAGTDNGDGTWTLDAGDLDGLQVTPPDDFSGSFDLSVTATSTETDGGDTATTTGTITVDVAADADDPTLTVDSTAGGTEDTAIALDIGAGLTDSSETLSVTISGVPDGAELSAGTDNGDGTWTLDAGDLNGLTVTPPENSNDDFQLTVTATSTDGDDTASTSSTIDVAVTGDADAAILTASAGEATTDGTTTIVDVDLDVSAMLTDTDGSETLSITIDGVPDGASLSAGTDNGDGTWSVDPDDLSGLQLSVPNDLGEGFNLTVNATTTEDDGDSQTVSQTVEIGNPDTLADGVDLDVDSFTAGMEDSAIPVNIDAGLIDTDGSESLSITISGVPDGAALSAGTDNGDGTWTLEPGDVDGLTITPPADSSEDFQLGVTATGTETSTGDTTSVTENVNVMVIGDADAPTLDVSDVTGDEDTAIPLTINTGLTDTDGSETLSVTVSNIPDGAVLSSGGVEITVENGSATLTAEQLEDLAIVPPGDSDGDFSLLVSATATEDDGDSNTVSGILEVTVEQGADAPTLDLSDAAGTEDGAIALDIGAGLTDASETLSVTISGVPDGAALSAGTDNGDGTWTLDAGDLNGLTVTPPADSDADFSLTVTATSTDGDDTATTSGTIDVSVAADADAPTLTLDETAGGAEDTAIALDISSGLTDTDGSETLSVTIGDVPDGAVLSAGTDNGDGTWTLDAGDLNGLTVTPPEDFNGAFDLTVTSTSTETDGGDTATSTGTITVDVGAVDDEVAGSTLETTSAAGTEDSAIGLNIDVTQLDTDGSESVSITISDVPDGAALSAGTDNGDGTWTLDAGDLDGLTVTPSADSNADFQLGVSVTTTESDGGDTTTTSATLDVDVTGDADAPTLTMTAADGDEDSAISLDISSGLTDTDGSETLSVTISDVPDGAVLSAGTDNGDGTWTLDAGDLDGLQVTPPADFSGSFDLTVTATTSENDGDTATTSGTLTVDVDGVADDPTLSVDNTAAGTEDGAIALDIGAGLGDSSESLSVTIAGVPDGAALSAGTDNGDGTWTLDAGDLNGLTVTPPADSDADFSLTVTATSTDGDDTATTSGTIDVSVAADADAPTLTLDETAGGAEDTAIALDISSGLTDTDGSETLSVTIGDVPDGAVLSAGTDNGDGTWTLDAGDLNGLTVTPPEDFNGAFDLTVTSTSTETDGGDTATSTGTITVDVGAVDDEVAGSTLETTSAAGTEDSAIGLNIDVTQLDTDGSESVSITISDVPDGAALSAGTDNGDGTWTLDAGDLDGLTVTPSADSNADFQLGVSVTTTESDGGDTTTTSATLDVDVTGDADAPTLTMTAADGDEDSAISLDISSGLTDTDGSETLSVTISDVPDGAVLSAGTDNGDGTWTLDAGDLDGLQVTPPADFSGSFDLTVTATTSENDGDTATTSGTLTVDVDGVADDPTLSVDNTAAGTEDGAIALDIGAGLGDSSESLSVTISGVPDGAALSAGTDNGDGTWTLDGGDLDGLTVTPPADSDADFSLTVTATSTDGDDTATTSGTIDVSVAADADAPTLTLDDTASGTEDGAINLDIASGLTDTDGSETLSVTVSGVPDGAALSAGTDNGDGTWTLDAGDLDGLQVTPPEDFSGSFDLSVTATSTEGDGGDTATTSGTITVDVAADADDPTMTLDNTAGGTEDTAIALDIDAGVTDSSESLSVTISGVPDGAALSAGTDNGDGTWTLDGGDLDGLTVTPPADSDGDFSLTVTATSTDGDDTATTSGTIDISVAADADAPTLVLDDTASGTEDGAISLDIASGLTDTDGSETLSVTVSGVPDGAALSAGTDNGDGTWTLDAGDLDGLQVTPPEDFSGSFDLSVTATSTEGDGGDTATTSGTITVDVAADADDPTLTVDDTAAGNEDTAIALDIDAGVTDSSESLSVTISGVPDGAELSAGTDNGDGTWTLDGGDLDGLTVTPGTDSNDDFQLTVTATSTDGSDTATTTSTIDVDVTGVADAPTLDVSISGGEVSYVGGGGGGIDPDDADFTSGNDDVTLNGLDQNDNISMEAGDDSLTITGDVAGGNNINMGAGDDSISFQGDIDGNVAVSGASGDDVVYFGKDEGDYSVQNVTDNNGKLSAQITDLETGQTVTVSNVEAISFGDGGSIGDTDLIDPDQVNGATAQVTYDLDIDTNLTDTDGSESLSITIGDLPDGASLSAGTENDDGSWTLSADDLDGLQLTVTGDNSGETFDLSVSATASEDDGDTATVSQTVTAGGAETDLSADGTTVDVSDASGTEDTAISLDIDVGLVDTDGSESMSITISGVPDGAELSAGTDNGDGTWSLDAGDLDGLTVTPSADSDADFSLTVSATSTESASGDTSTTTGTIDVSVAADADAPTLTLDDTAAGTEDGAINLDIASGLTDTDGSETLSVTVSGVPDGAELSAGTDNGDGTWTLDAGDLDGLQVTPPEDFSGSFDLSVTATSTEGDGGDTATSSGTITVDVAADADDPTLILDSTSAGTEDTAIALDIDAGVTDSSESLSVTISGVPDGAELSAGTDNGDGTWTLEGGDLDGLTVTPPADSDGDFQLTVTATSTDGDDSATTSGTIDVSVAADADAPTLTLDDTAGGTEDTAIDLDIASGLTDTDGSETLSVTVSGVPDGAELSAGTDNGDGTWTLDAGDLDGLQVTPPDDFSGSFDLSVTATSTEGDGGDTATTSGTITVDVAAEADDPTLTLDSTSAGTEDTAIALDIDAGVTDSSESLSVTISGVPDGAELSAGTDNGDGTWTLEGGDLDGLTVTPPADSDGDFSLTVTATSTDGDDTATSTGTIDVSVAADADAPTLTLDSTAEGTEDTAISLDIASGLTDTDGSESLSVTISGVPDGASLNAGTDNGDGTWTLDAGDLDGLQVTPPADSNDDFDLTVTATSTEGDGGDTATTTGTITVDVTGDADTATLSVDDASGAEDTAISLDIDATLTDTDGSETVSVTIADVPDGASLSAGTDNGDGTWTLDAGDLDGLSITPPQDYSGDFNLTVTATTTEDDGDTSSTSSTLSVSVAEVDDSVEGSTLDVSDAAGTEDTAVSLDIGVTQADTDGSESISVTVSGVPDGASLNAGTDNGDGTWTLDSGDLDGLEITPPADSNADFELGVSVTTTETSTGESSTVTGTIDVDLTGDADTATLSASLGDDTADVSGVTYDLDVTAALADTDGSETLSVTISDVPDGVSFDAGTDNGDGTWTFEAGDIGDLAMTVPDGTPAFDLNIAATASEDDGDTATTSATISVEATDTSADEADLTTTAAAGNEDSAIALDIDASLVDGDGSETMSVTISDVPDGAALSAGTDNGDGTWTLDAGDLDGLTVTPAADSNEDFSLSVSVTTTEESTGDTATTTATLDVDVTGVADAPTLSVSVEHSGQTSAETDVDVPDAISGAASGDDSVVVSGVPDGAFLNAGTDNGDGTWTLDAGDLDGLTVMPAEGSTDTISLSFDVPSSESAGDTLTSDDFSGGVGDWSGDAESSNGQLMLEGDATTSQTFDFGPEHAGQTVTISFDADAQNDWEESGSYQDYFDVSANGTQVISTSEESSTSYSFEVTLDENGQVSLEMSTDTTASDERVMIDNLEITAGDDWDASLASADLDVEPEAGGTVYDVDLMDIQSSLTDTDGSETLSITVDGLPEGATLTAGTDNGDGTWTLDAGDIDDLEMLVPAGSGDFDLAVSATATEDDGDTNTVSTTVTVVEPDTEADGATIDTTDAAGSEDTAIALDIDVTQTDTDGSESMSITISDVPDGAALSAGTDNGDGTWTLDAGDLDGLTVTPGDDSNTDFTLGVSVTTTETSTGDTATTTTTLDVDVAGVADAPTLSADVTFNEMVESETDVSVPTTITDAATGDNEVTVSGVPSGASLSAGTDNGDGTWTLEPADLTDLTVTPADGETADIDLSFDVSGSGGSGDALFSDNFDSGVSGWGGEAESYSGGMEIEQDESATRTFDFGDEHAGQTVTISFDSSTWGSWDESGSYQDNFVVTANGSEVLDTSDSGDNSYSMTVTLDENGQLSLDMNVDSTSSGEGMDIDNFEISAGDDWSSSLASETVTVDVEEPGMVYDLDITAGLTDTDGSETLSVTVSDVPDGASLSAGTDNGDGTWTIESGDLDGLQMTVPAETADFDLGIAATATEGDGDTNSVSATVSVSTPDVVAEDATLSTSDATGEEDRAIALDIDASLTDTDGSETMSITIDGVPDGAALSAGTDNGDGSWTLDSGDLADLTILPAEDSSTDFSLTVSATTTESTSGDTSTVTSTIDVTVDGVADAPELSVNLGDAVEVGGGATPVSYWQLDENDGNDTLVDAVGDNDGTPVNDLKTDNETGVFDGAAEFSGGGKGSDNDEYIEVPHSDDLKPDSGSMTLWFNADKVDGGEGSDQYTLASSDNSGDGAGEFGLFIQDGEMHLKMESSSEDMEISGGDVDKDEWNQVTVTWGEDGANVYLNGELVASDDSWTDGMSGNENPWIFGASEGSGSMDDFFNGHMDDIAIYDEQLSADDVQSLFDDGVEDVMNEGGDESLQYPLDITASLSDTDGSESMAISIDGLPDGAVLSAGTDNGDGSWSVDSGDLDSLTLTVPADSDDFVLSVEATVTDEGGDTRTATEMVQVDVGDDGFDAGTVGTESADSITGTAGADTISGEGGDDTISAGDGDDTVLGGAGDDNIDAGDGDDVVDAGAGNDTIDSGAGDDDIMGGQGDDLFIFGAGDGADYFQGGDGWSDTVQIDGVDSGPGGDSGWTLQVDEGAGYTETDSGVEFDAEASGVITLADGSELTFDGVEKLEW